MWWSYVAFSAIAFFRRYAMKPMPAKQRIITAQAAADLFGPLGWVVLERQSRQLDDRFRETCIMEPMG